MFVKLDKLKEYARKNNHKFYLSFKNPRGTKLSVTGAIAHSVFNKTPKREIITLVTSMFNDMIKNINKGINND